MAFVRVLSFMFSIAVAFFWLKVHFFTKPENWLPLGFPLFVWIAVTAFGWFFFYRKKIPAVTLTPLRTASIVFLGGFFLFNLSAFVAPWIFRLAPLLPASMFLEMNLAFLIQWTILMGLFFLLTALFLAAGHFVEKLLFKENWRNSEDPYSFFICIAGGLALLAAFFLFLGMIDLLKPWVILGCLTALLIFERKFLEKSLRKIFTEIRFRLEIRDPISLVFTIALFLITLNLLATLRPSPTGYDDMTYYMNRVHLMSERGALLPGGLPFPFELLASAIRITTGDPDLFLAMSFGMYSLFLGVAALYTFGRSLFGLRGGLIAAVILLATPMAGGLALHEVKPDSLLLFLGVLIFWSLVRLYKKKDLSSLFALAFLFGFAVTVKFTGLFFLGPIVLVLLLLWPQRKTIHFFPWKESVIAIFFFLLPILPWAIYAHSTRIPETNFLPTRILASTPSTKTLELRQEFDRAFGESTCRVMGTNEEYARFSSPTDLWSKIFFLPWYMTMNTRLGYYATEIGFLFLALLPFFFFIPFEKQPIGSSYRVVIPLLGLMTLAYFFFWLAGGRFIPWYGYPGLILLSLLITLLFDYFPKKSLSQFLLWLLLFLGLIGNTLFWLRFAFKMEEVRYAGGIYDDGAYLESFFPGYGKAESLFNQNLTSRIYLAGNSFSLWYSIQNNDERAFLDEHLDHFDCLLQKTSEENVVEKLQALRIRYFLLSRSLFNSNEEMTPRTLQLKGKRALDFSASSLHLIQIMPDFFIYEVPEP